MGSGEENAQEGRDQVGEDMFYRVTVDGRHCDWSRPLMMPLMDVFVDVLAVQKPGTIDGDRFRMEELVNFDNVFV